MMESIYGTEPEPNSRRVSRLSSRNLVRTSTYTVANPSFIDDQVLRLPVAANDLFYLVASL
jgi:hypothetical protein